MRRRTHQVIAISEKPCRPDPNSRSRPTSPYTGRTSFTLHGIRTRFDHHHRTLAMTGSTLAAQLVQARRQPTQIDARESLYIPADAEAASAIQHEVLTLSGARIGAWK